MGIPRWLISALATNTAHSSALAELAGSSSCKTALQSRVECSRISSSHGTAGITVSEKCEDYGVPGGVSLSMSAQAVVAITYQVFERSSKSCS